MFKPMEEHVAYMKLAIQLAIATPKAPFVSLLVDCDSGETISTGINRTDRNPLRHGEIDCIESAVETHREINWCNTRLYTTAEPCCMCQAAILWCGIPEVIFGTSIPTLRALGWKQFAIDANAVIQATPFAECRLIGGIAEANCDALFRAAAKLKGFTPQHRRRSGD